MGKRVSMMGKKKTPTCYLGLVPKGQSPDSEHADWKVIDECNTKEYIEDLIDYDALYNLAETDTSPTIAAVQREFQANFDLWKGERTKVSAKDPILHYIITQAYKTLLNYWEENQEEKKRKKEEG